MAKKQETVSMIDSLQEFKDLKNIDKETMINVLEESFRNVIAKMFGTDENYDVIINPEKGDFEIWRNRTVVENGHVSDPNLEVSLRDAQQIDADCTIGEEVTDEVHFADFGRRAILNLRQALASKILELQKDNLTAKYRELIGTIVVADVYQVWKKEVLLLDDEGNELLLPKSEQIPGDFYRKGEAVRAVVQRVETDNNTKIYLSRTDKAFLQRLFEIEVPEINDGLITIRSIARIPGERAKIAVESYDERIDPVGACVGMKGSRIRGIVRELRNENIDVVNYTTNTALYIQRALSPAKVSSIRVDEEEHKAEVFLRPEEVSLAIGKNGLNIKLASMLTDYTIDVFRDIDTADEEDIYLDEFADEVEPWVIEALKEIGCNTAKAVLALAPEEIMERADLEEQTVDDLLRVLSAEFEDEAQPAPDDYAPEEEQPVDEQPVDTTDASEPADEQLADTTDASEPVDEQPAESTDEPDETPTEDEPEEDDADEEADNDTPEVFQEDDTDEKEED